jgi:hypothetical protein
MCAELNKKAFGKCMLEIGVHLATFVYCEEIPLL